jgi:hypothetical protein
MLTSQVIVTADFNTTFPADWMSTGNASDGGWAVHTGASVSSQYWTAADPADGTTFVGTNDDACNCDKSVDRLVMPTLDLSAAADFLFLSYDKQYFNRAFQTFVEKLAIEVSYDGGTTWEEYYEIPGNTQSNWQNEVLNVSDLRRESSVTLAFRYDDMGGWMFGAALDNITLYSPPAYDVRSTQDSDYPYVDQDFNVNTNITNLGGETITSIDVTYDLGSGPVTETISGLNIAPLETQVVSVSAALPMPTSYSLSVSTSNPNGEMDADMSNNDYSKDIIGVANPPAKMVFVEESTGTWCPWCPRGAVFMDMMEENFAETFAGVAVHVGAGATWPDPMEVPVYGQTYAGSVSGFPTLVVDRSSNPGIPGINSMLTYGASLRDFTTSRPSPIGVNVNAGIDESTNQLIIDVEVSAHSNIDNQIFAVLPLITEDHVTGDGFDYRQANNYAGGGQGPMGGWEVLPNPASGNDIEFNHTLRAAPAGYSGDATIIPSSIKAGETYNYSTTIDIPAAWDNTELNVAVVILDLGNGGAALNAGMVRGVGILSAVEEIDALSAFNTYPNPVQDQINVELNFTENLNYNINVMDVLGNKVMDLGQFNNNGLKESFNVAGLSAGMYFIAVHTELGQNVMKFTKL